MVLLASSGNDLCAFPTKFFPPTFIPKILNARPMMSSAIECSHVMSYLICKWFSSDCVTLLLRRVFSIRNAPVTSSQLSANSSHRLVSHNFGNCFRSRNTDLYCIITASLICAIWNLGRFFSLEYRRSAYPQNCASWTRVVCVPYKRPCRGP